MRLIDADALKKALRSNCTPEICHDYKTAWCVACCPHNDFEDLLDDAPTVEGKLSDKQIEEIADLLETNWGWEGIREEVTRILKGGAE